uniref:Uncharacterized protein n=1 Tax=Ditylenchus dipsaci TaxID=166011 RepID=A0A915DA39_9BILA
MTTTLNNSTKAPTTDSSQSNLQQWPLMPTGCVFMLEFFERFSYYGIRAFLVLYLTNVLQLDGFQSIVLFHSMAFLAYSSCLIGGILGDVYIGRMDTIFWSSIAIVIAQVLLAASPLLSVLANFKPYLELTSLLILFTSFGILKPCIAAFGADQFLLPTNAASRVTYPQSLSCYFATLYFVANLGGLTSLFSIPTALAFPCSESEVCFPAGFALPAMSMGVVTILFITTKCLYRKVTPPPANLILQSITLIRKALANRQQSELNRKNRVPWKETDHWLEHCLDDHDCAQDNLCKYLPPNICAESQFCTALKAVMSVGLVLAPVPLFWAMMELQGPLWMAQAINMDTRLAILLVLTIIPMFQFVIYPMSPLSKCCILTYLKRMAIAGLLATLAFLMSVGVQHIVDMTVPAQPPEGYVLATVFNRLDPECTITALTGDPTEVYAYPVENSSMPTPMQISLAFAGSCSGHKFVRYKMYVTADQWNYIFVTPQGIFSHSTLLSKPSDGNGESLVSLSVAVPCSAVGPNLVTKNCPGPTSTIRQSLTPFLGQFILCQTIQENSSCLFDGNQLIWSTEETTSYPTLFAFAPKGDSMGQGSVASYTSKSVQPGSYKLFLTTDVDPNENSSLIAVTEQNKDVEITGMSGVYILGITLNDSVLSTSLADDNSTDLLTPTSVYSFAIASPNYMSILWQLPQYLLITAAEVMFAITGMEFCYIEAPEPLKSIVLSFWTNGSTCIKCLRNANVHAPLLPGMEESMTSVASTEDVPLYRGVMDELEVLRNAALSKLPRQFVTRL